MTVFRWLGNFLLGLTAVYLYFIVVESLTTVYQTSSADQVVNEAILRGTYAPIFWTSIAFLAVSFALLLLQFVRRSYHLGWLVLAGILVNLAALGKRFLIVVPSQTHGTTLPYAAGAYSPTLVEYGVVTGLIALGALLFILFAKLFPIMEIAPAAVPETMARPTDRRRIGLAWILVAGGFALQIVAYFFLATPLGLPTSVAFSDPRLPFAPALFIFGVMMVFAAALVYELLPEPERSRA